MKSWLASLSAVIFLCSIPGLASSSSRPSALLIYYGYPSLINGSNGVVATAAGQFSRYTHVVLGDTLQATSHLDHAKTKQIIAHASVAAVKFFGYIDLGVTNGTQNLSLTEINLRAAAWASMGVDGILLDDYGYDYGVTRERQNAAVQAVRSHGLAVIANAFRVEDAFGTTPSSANPNGVAPILTGQDFYLYESHQVRLGFQDDPSTWMAKSMLARQYRASVGFGLLSITTPLSSGAFDAGLWRYAWFSAALFDHTATGWGDLYYGASNSQSPFRTRPVADESSFATLEVSESGGIYSRNTCLNRLWIDSVAVTAGQTAFAGCLDIVFRNGFEQ